MNHTVCFERNCPQCNTRYGNLYNSWKKKPVPTFDLGFKRNSANTLNIPLILPLTARAVVPTVSIAPSVNVNTTLGVNFVVVDWKEEIIPPKVSRAFLAMISE